MKTKAMGVIVLVVGCLALLGEARAQISELDSGDFLFPGQRLTASQCYYRLEMQGDGNLVTYDIFNRARWDAGTRDGGPFARGGYAVEQEDGNFVIYNWSDQAVWATNRAGWANSRVIQQLDGNLVQYSSPLNWVLFNSGLVAERGFSSPCQTPGVKTHVDNNVDRDGHVFQSFSVPRASWCGFYCSQNSSCKAYTVLNGTCFLKDSAGPPHAVSTSLTGIVSGVIVR